MGRTQKEGGSGCGCNRSLWVRLGRQLTYMLASAVFESFPGGVVARFLELRGRRIIHECGALWYSVPGRFLMSLPYETMLNPKRADLCRMIREERAAGVRFPSSDWAGLESG